MTEQEWLACTDPHKMLEFPWGKVSDRKMRLVACACCRRIPGFLDSQPDREGLELTERDADGLAVEEDIAARFDLVWIFNRTTVNGGWNFIQVSQMLLPGDKSDVIPQV